MSERTLKSCLLPEFPTAARISEFVAQLEELVRRTNPTSYAPTEPHLWPVGKIPPKTLENCRKTCERKSRTHSYDDLVDPLIKLPMVRENDSHMDKYVRRNMRGRPLLRRFLEGGYLKATLTLGRAEVGS